MLLIRGGETFRKTKFTVVFQSINDDVYVQLSLYINQIKICFCFEKFYDIYLSLIGVFKKPHIIGDFLLEIVVVVVVVIAV